MKRNKKVIHNIIIHSFIYCILLGAVKIPNVWDQKFYKLSKVLFTGSKYI